MGGVGGGDAVVGRRVEDFALDDHRREPDAVVRLEQVAPAEELLPSRRVLGGVGGDVVHMVVVDAIDVDTVAEGTALPLLPLDDAVALPIVLDGHALAGGVVAGEGALGLGRRGEAEEDQDGSEKRKERTHGTVSWM